MRLMLMLPLFAYLIGSIPWGLILTRIFTTVDIRTAGSGNIGATNVRRAAGTWLGILTLMGDVLKGAAPVYAALRISDGNEIYSGAVALIAFLGHLYPVYLKGKSGGKGVATAGGCFLVLSPAALSVSLLVFILLVCMTSRVSAGSLAGSAFLPLAVWKATGSSALALYAGIVAAGILIRHRGNILRLIQGVEPKL